MTRRSTVAPIQQTYRLQIFLPEVNFPLVSPAKASLAELKPLLEEFAGSSNYVGSTILVEIRTLDGDIVSRVPSMHCRWNA